MSLEKSNVIRHVRNSGPFVFHTNNSPVTSAVGPGARAVLVKQVTRQVPMTSADLCSKVAECGVSTANAWPNQGEILSTLLWYFLVFVEFQVHIPRPSPQLSCGS